MQSKILTKIEKEKKSGKIVFLIFLFLKPQKINFSHQEKPKSFLSQRDKKKTAK